jgi:hypothetical protein
MNYRAYPWPHGRKAGASVGCGEGPSAGGRHSRHDWAEGLELGRGLRARRRARRAALRALRDYPRQPLRPRGRCDECQLDLRTLDRRVCARRRSWRSWSLAGDLPAPATAIYSRTHGVVNWRTCMLRENDRRRILRFSAGAMRGSASTRQFSGRSPTACHRRKASSGRSIAAAHHARSRADETLQS